MHRISEVLANGVLHVDCVSDTLEIFAQRLVTWFSEVQETVPRYALQLLSTYWRSRVPPLHRTFRVPLRSDHPHVLIADSPALPRVFYEGFAIHFPVMPMEEMGPEFAKIAIMHELAHVTFYAEGEPNHWTDIDPGVDENEHKARKTLADQTAELLVHERLLTWGVDQTRLLAWRDEYEHRTGIQ